MSQALSDRFLASRSAVSAVVLDMPQSKPVPSTPPHTPVIALGIRPPPTLSTGKIEVIIYD